MTGAGVEVGGTTRVMGVIGDPIAQARTPEAINPIFVRMGADIVCVPMHVPSPRLEAAWAGLQALENVVGFGVTLPHKQAAHRLCDSLDPLAARMGAVNVVRRERDGTFRGYQFDGRGFVRGLERASHRVEGRDVLMVGAGGAAIAIAFALAEAGVACITVANRTAAKAEALVHLVNDAIGRSVAHVGPAEPRPGQLIVNATSLGLREDDALPLAPDRLDDTMLVAEVIARPETTPLLAAAAARGAATHSGLHMIRGQVDLIAAHMTELWGAGSQGAVDDRLV